MNIYKRQSNFVKPEQLDFPILLIGAGGTGSWAYTALKKMGITCIYVVDFDIIEAHNAPSQFYNEKDIGKIKSLTLIQPGSGDTAFVGTFEQWFESNPNLEKIHFPVVISAIDSMDERIKLWDIIKKRDDVELFIDPRIGGELLRMYAVDPLDNKAVTFYESTLYPSSKTDPLPCGSRQIVYTTMFTGALIANYMKKYANKEPIRAETIIDFNQMQIV